MVSPKALNCFGTSTVESPVTVNALLATKKASINDIGFLPVTGKYNSREPITVVVKNSDKYK
ncbi:hypothetical protein SGA02_21390 [Staphylococcus gallinarum]|uniref:Uncharacterized protein n=1 Tax=Staphylococcus gallinarum TaxID=1293 RepID=A0ABQ0Y4J9_STAGA|nr:hypothetical protein SGA02_21390 [Staphylococcus gallinarum]